MVLPTTLPKMVCFLSSQGAFSPSVMKNCDSFESGGGVGQASALTHTLLLKALTRPAGVGHCHHTAVAEEEARVQLVSKR